MAKPLPRNCCFSYCRADEGGRSPKSYNSAIGVPLALWNIAPDDEVALIEAGISEPREMEPLETIIQPHWGVITHIGEAHQENFPLSGSEGAREDKAFHQLREDLCPL